MGEWLLIADAAERLKVSKTALRRRVDRKSIQAQKDEAGRWLVYVEEEETAEPADEVPRDTTQGTPQGTPDSSETITRDLVAVLRDQLAEKDRQLAAREREVQELHVLLGNTQRLLSANVSEPIEGAVRTAERFTAYEDTQKPNASPEGVREETGPLQRPRPSWFRRFFFGEE